MSLHLSVAVLTIGWCLLHSLLITTFCERWLQRAWPVWQGFGRLLYIVGSILSFALLYWYFASLPARSLWTWPGAWAILRYAGLLSGLLLMLLGSRGYDQAFFFGLRQAECYLRGRQPDTATLHRRGILGVVRHPYYTGGILILAFGTDVDDINLIWRSLLILYLLVGSELEERKLLAEHGESYRRYRREVPRFVPRFGRPPSGPGSPEG